MKLFRLLSLPFLMLAWQILAAQQPSFPRTIATTGKLPQLAWSAGADRLGSAKMGYIDTGIVLTVTDTLPGLYRVQLARNRHAFIDRNLARPVAEQPLPPVTSESWTVKGLDNGDDLVAINLGRQVAWQSRMETDPARIVVELYGVQSNTNWITQLQSARVVKEVDYEQAEDDVLRVIITLKQAMHYGYSIGYEGRQLQLRIRPLPASGRLRGKTIVVDAGHGGTNTGARGLRSGILEKDYTLQFALAFREELERRGARVLMIRDRDTTIDNKDRVLWTQQQRPDAFISFHLNSSGRETARGTSTYYKHAAFSPLSRSILDRMLGISNLPEFGLVGSFNFQPVQPTDYASCLVEVAFLSNPEDEQLILNPAFHKQVARKVRLGLEDWFRQLR